MLFTTRLAGKMRHSDLHITLVNEADNFTERLRLHQFAANHPMRRRPIADTLRGTGITFVQGRATSILPASHEVLVTRDDGAADAPTTERLRYDYLVYALGSQTERHSVPGVDQYAYTLAPRGPLSAAALRETLPEVAAASGRVVVCGGGATGIETAAEFATTYPGLQVRLVTDGALGMAWNKGIARYMRRSLERAGVAITDHTAVAAIQPGAVVTAQGEPIPFDVCLWAGGFVAPSLARESGLPVNDRDQVIVDPYLRVEGHPDIYAVGDAASPRVDPGVPVRMSAVTATILAAHGADSLVAALRGRAPKPLSFAYLGQGIALGRHNAIGFNNYPADRPVPPYFTGRLGYQVRELFVQYLAAAPALEWRFPGSFVWFGKGRFAAAQRRQRSKSARQQRQRIGLRQA